MRALIYPLASAPWLKPAFSRTWATRALLLFMAYYACGRMGLATPQVGEHISLVWASAGIALVAFLRHGPSLWPAVWLAALAVNLSTPVAPWAAVMLAVGNTLGPLFGASWLRRQDLHPELDRRRDLWLYALFGVGVPMALTASNGTFWLVAAGALRWADVPLAWLAWWLGDAMGALVVGVPLLTLSRQVVRDRLQVGRWLPTALLAGAAVLSGWLAFTLPDTGTLLSPLVFLPHLLLCWLAVRSGIFVASSAALLLTTGTVIATLNGQGPFFQGSATASLALLSGYVVSLSAMPLLVTALMGELAGHERRWQLALDISHIGVGEWDLRSQRVEFSPRWLAMLGYEHQDFGTSLQAFWSRVHPDDAPALQRAFEPLRRAAAVNCRAECRLLRQDGRWSWFELHALVAERSADGEPLRIVNTARDIDERRAAREHQQLSDSLFRHLHEGLLITDAQLRVLQVNPMYCEISGRSREQVLGSVPSMLAPLAGAAAEPDGAALVASLQREGSWRGELQDQRLDGTPCTLQVTVSVVRDDQGAVKNHVVAVSDITLARQHVEQLQRQAHYDALTGLPNRVHLSQQLQAALATKTAGASLLTVCYLDVDHFKAINERHGVEAGDRLLVELAERMRRSLRSWAGGDDLVARIGGDEFVLLLRTATLAESRHAVERVLRQIAQPCSLGLPGGAVSVTASIGATVYPIDGADAETLLRHADHAMQGAKQAGRNGHLFFDAEHDRRAEARFVALGRLQEALDREEFCLHFQPKVDMRLGRVLGVEALLRWNHPEDGLLPPGRFLPLVEHTGLGVQLGQWVLGQGIAQLAHWQHIGLDLTLSVNISARHLQEPDFAQALAQMLARHRTPVAHRLIIEVLETTALADIDHSCELMNACRAMGVRFALDDFGTGYSTLTYLRQLPLDMLKIDRSFVGTMLGDRQDLAIVEGVIGLARTFGCSVVAEGVETAEQARRLIEVGCDIGQGHGIAPPMPAAEVPDWVAAFKGMRGLRPTLVEVGR